MTARLHSLDELRSEHDDQVALFAWAGLAMKQNPDLAMLFAIPNQGAGRNRRLQDEGVCAGVPDMFLAVPRGPFNGFFIEMKSRTGTLSAAQKWWLEELERRGYATAVCRSFEEARDALIRYLEGRF